MRSVEITRSLFHEKITALALPLEEGLHVSICGGSRPHIGAVSIVSPEGERRTWQFPGHKDGVVSERWAEALSRAGFRPVVVEAGIHYDALRQEEIAAVVALTDKMLKEILEALL